MGEGNLTTGLIWPGCEGCTNWSDLASDEGARRGGVGQGRGQGGGEMGGGTREQCGSNKACTGSPFGLT